MSDEFDSDLFRGNLIATRAMLTAILTHLGRTGGEDLLGELQRAALADVARVERRMHADAETRPEIDTAKEVISCAEGYVSDAFNAAFDKLD